MAIFNPGGRFYKPFTYQSFMTLKLAPCGRLCNLCLPLGMSPKPFCTFATAFVLYLSRSRNTLSHFFFGIRSFAVWGLAVWVPVLLFHCMSAFLLISLSLLEQILAVVLFSSNYAFCIFFMPHLFFLSCTPAWE